MSASDVTVAYFLAEWAIRLAMIVIIPLRRPPEAARSWLLLIFFLPIPGLVLYHLIGRADFPNWRRNRFQETKAERERAAADMGGTNQPASQLQKLVEKLGGFPACGGNSVDLLTDYNSTIDAMINAIDAADRRVYLLTYIFADDETGRKVADALSRAKSRGVEVNVMFDALGSRPWASRSMAMLKERGIDAKMVLPGRMVAFRRPRRDLRNHRKLCTIDGRVGFVGSQNIVDRDFKRGIVNDELVALVEGPVVAALDSVFASDWFMETETALPQLASAGAAGESTLQAMPSGPDFGVAGFESLLVELVHHAERYVAIVTPYLIPDEALLTAFKNATAKGVEVDLIVSQVVDQRLVRFAQRSYYQELLQAGVRIYRYSDRLLHAKNTSIDGAVGVVGSSNVDIRSFRLNAEISLIMHDKRASARLAAVQQEYIDRSDRLTHEVWSKRSKSGRLIENLARLISSLL